MNSYLLTEAELVDLIQKLKLPKVIMEIYNEDISDEIVQEELGYNYSKPYSILELDAKEQATYQVERYKPILELDNARIIAYDTETKGYITYDIEQGFENPEHYTWDGVFLEEVSFWYEFELEEDTILHLGKAFDLRYTKEIIDSLDEAGEKGELSTFEGKNNWIEQMLDKLNLRVS